LGIAMFEKRRKHFVGIAALFVLYSVLAVRPVPPETVLVPKWLSSLESGEPIRLGDGQLRAAAYEPLPFVLGSRFGYVGPDGRFSLNRTKTGRVSIARGRWAEFGAMPGGITVYDGSGAELKVIDAPDGYPFFLDGRTFVIGSGQSSVSEIDPSGAVSWTFEFPSPLTSIDAAAGLLLAGSVDGVAVVVDGFGRQVFSFDPGGSRFSVILGTAISADGSRLAIVSGIDSQRFLVLERFGAGLGDYRVVYHEFLGEGFRRPVHVAFVENDGRIVFERRGGLGIYDVGSRITRNVEVEGELRALDGSGGQGLMFAVFSNGPSAGGAMDLVGIQVSGRAARVVTRAPFRSGEVFLGRMGSRLIVGGGQALIAFDLEKR